MRDDLRQLPVRCRYEERCCCWRSHVGIKAGPTGNRRTRVCSPMQSEQTVPGYGRAEGYATSDCRIRGFSENVGVEGEDYCCCCSLGGSASKIFPVTKGACSLAARGETILQGSLHAAHHDLCPHSSTSTVAQMPDSLYTPYLIILSYRVPYQCFS